MILIVPIACLFPLTVYCAVLSGVNRRPHPVVVSGPWDVAGLLFAISGFALFAGPCMLSGFNQHWREYWLFSRSASPFRGLGDRGWSLWLGVWAVYFVGVLGGAIFLLRKRRHVLSIYNVDAAVVPDVLGQVLGRLGLEWARRGNQVFVAASAAAPRGSNGAPAAAIQAVLCAPTTAEHGRLEAQQQPPIAHRPVATGAPEGQRLLLEFDPFPAMRHISLCWAGDAGPARPEIEAELRKALALVPSGHNPAALWLGSIACSLFTIMFVALVSWIAVSIMANLQRP